MLTRPQHLVDRQIAHTFAEDATLIRSRGSYDENGEWVEDPETETAIKVATSPVSSNSERARQAAADGIRLDSLRLFWTRESLDPAIDDESAGDIVVYDGERYRISESARWGGFSESVGQRQEGQDPA